MREFFHEPSVPLARLMRDTHVPGLHIVPANIRLARVAQALYMRPRREEILTRGIAPLRPQYAFFEPKSTGALAYESFAKEMLRYGR